MRRVFEFKHTPGKSFLFQRKLSNVEFKLGELSRIAKDINNVYANLQRSLLNRLKVDKNVQRLECEESKPILIPRAPGGV